MKETTKRQQAILDIVNQFIEEHGCSPTYVEIAERDGVSVACVIEHLKALEKKGYLSRTPGRNRSIVIL